MEPLLGASSAQVLEAVDRAIVMGSALYGNLLKAVVEAHHKAIGSIDAMGVTSAADLEAVNAALGRAVASVPTSKVMDIYNALASVVNLSGRNKLFSTVSAADRQMFNLARVKGLCGACCVLQGPDSMKLQPQQ